MSFNNKTNEYFAAANGFFGFRSYFDKIFSSREYDSVFVLKGGPGTGKSSLMKRIYEVYATISDKSELIYCSSDPKSLDGVIIEAHGKRAAILDGTAPHERDAVIPGAIDNIVNLGDGWNNDKLRAYRDEIIYLSERKKRYYSHAYFLMSQAGRAFTEKYKILSACINTAALNKTVTELISELPEDGVNSENVRLISSFGKNGIYALTPPCIESCKKIKIGRVDGAEYFFMKRAYELLHGTPRRITVFPSPFDDSLKDMILTNIDNFCISIVDNEATDIEMRTLFKICSLADKDFIKALNGYESAFLEEARQYFNLAAVEHARLEDIFIGAMNFSINDEKILEIEEDIRLSLGL